jgi:hypothetical protein
MLPTVGEDGERVKVAAGTRIEQRRKRGRVAYGEEPRVIATEDCVESTGTPEASAFSCGGIPPGRRPQRRTSGTANSVPPIGCGIFTYGGLGHSHRSDGNSALMA